MKMPVRPVVILSLIAFLNGCASQSVSPYTSQPTGDRVIPRDIIVTAARFQPEAKLDLLMRSKAELAGEGAAGGALQGVGGLLQGMGSCHDQFCAAAFLLLLPVFMGVGAVIGAAQKAPSAAAPETIESGQKAMQEGISRLNLQRAVQSGIAKELLAQGVAGNVAEEWDVGPATPEEMLTYETVNPGTRDAILEVSVLGFQFINSRQPDSKKLNYLLSMQTRIRLLAPTNRAILDEMNYVHKSEPHTATEWLRNDASLFGAALKDAIQNTSQAAVAEMFLLYYPKDALETKPADKRLVPEYVPNPVYPLPTRTIDLRAAFVDKYKTSLGGLAFVPVDSLQPTLRWEAFPRPVDVDSLGGEAGRFSDVFYEVAIYDAKLIDAFYQPGEMIYKRSGLDVPSHKLERPLDACARYYWTVRASFKLEGWPRITEWMGAYDVFKSGKPWEYRRGLMTGPFNLGRIQPRLFYLPFRAPTAYGSACD